MTEFTEPDRKDLLLKRAKLLGINHSPNIGADTLAEKIREFEENVGTEAAVETAPARQETVASRTPRKPNKAQMLAMTKDEIRAYPIEMRKNIIRERQKAEELRLVRVRIHCNNPIKAEMGAEIVTVGNPIIGVVRKVIPFGEATENGYHIPFIMLKALRAKKYQQIRVIKVDGREKTTRSLVPEYTIQELPPLGRDELEELAMAQEAAKRMGG